MKTYKTYSAAHRNNHAGQPIIKVGDQFLVFDRVIDEDITELGVIRDGIYTGQVTIRHLERLGNANHATAQPPLSRTSLPSRQEMYQALKTRSQELQS